MIAPPIYLPPVQSSMNKIDHLVEELKKQGAVEGAKRLQLIRARYRQLTPHTAYLWLNPIAVQEEIEEAKISQFWMQAIYLVRNVLSLAPLICTWLALFFAATGYQQDLMMYPADNTIPFLQLWQGSFHGFEPFSFTEAAGLDVALLVLYLLSVLAVQWFERSIHVRAVSFIESETWQKPVNALMQDIEKANTPYVASKSDIDTVVDAVNRIVTEMTTTLRTTVNETADNLKQAAMQMVDANRQMIEQSGQSIKTLVVNTQQSLTQAITASEQAMNQHLSASTQSTRQIVTSAEEAVTQTLTLSKQSISEANRRVETLFEAQVKPLIEAFRQDVTALQKEMANYQDRLAALTQAGATLGDAGVSLAGTSKVLAENAERYLTIGQDLKAQIAALNSTQQDVLSQIGGIAGAIGAASGNMIDARANMVAAIHEVQMLTQRLERGMQKMMDSMSTSVAVSQSLERVAPPLEAASDRLYQASDLLSSIQASQSARAAKRRWWPFGKRSVTA